MPYEVHIHQRRAGDRIGDVYELIDNQSTFRAEIWPHWGLNCLRWQIRQADGRWADLFYVAPDWEFEPIPTRSGHAVLFPFPGRLRDGRFIFNGTEYQLPLNDATKRHAIHGFTPRHRWRIADWNSDEQSAYVTGECILADDMPGTVHLWPANFKLAVTYRLLAHCLRVEATVTNLDDRPLPFGLGYHPYFCLPGVHDPDINHYYLCLHAQKIWESVELLPTGRQVQVTDPSDFRRGRAIGDQILDTVFTDITTKPQANGLRDLARLSHPAAGAIHVQATPEFREVVVFTPPHRQAIAIEPYTCAADAANLTARHIDAGWTVLPPGAVWHATVVYRWEPATA